MGIKEKLEELSLLDLSKRSGTELASLQTRHFSTERRGIQGDAPRSTKLITSKIDFSNDWITYYFLTEATEKYGPDYQYKDVEPDKNFQFERNPSKTYEIQLRFYHLSQLVNGQVKVQPELPAGEAPEPMAQPAAPAAPSVAPPEASEPPESTDNRPTLEPNRQMEPQKQPIATSVPSKTPSIPIRPKDASKTPQKVPNPSSKGNPRQALKQPLPKVKVAPDEPVDRPSQLSLFGNDEQHNVPAGNPNPVEKPEEEEIDKVVTQQESTLHEEGLTAYDIKYWLWHTDMAIWSNSPSFHWQGFNYNLSQLQAAIFPTDIEPQVWDKVHGPALIDKHLYDLFVHMKFFLNNMAGSLLNKIRTNRESRNTKMITKTITKTSNIRIDEKMPDPNPMTWSRDAWGETFDFVVAGSSFTATFETESDRLQYVLMAYVGKKDMFSYDFEVPFTWQERKKLYNEMSAYNEIHFMFGDNDSGDPIGLTNKGHVGQIFATILAGVRKYINRSETKIDIFSFSADTDSASRTALYLRLTKEMIREFPDYRMVLASGKGTTGNFIFVVTNEVYAKLYGSQMTEAMETSGIRTDLICTFGTFCPPTRDHIALLQKIVKTAESRDGSNVVFIQSDPYFKGDEVSSKIKADALANMVPDLNVCINEEIESFYDAMVWAYNRKYTNITVIVGNDQQVEFEALLADYNGQTTAQGFFEFDEFKVVSYGKDNPDKSKAALAGRQALSDGDFEAFMSALSLPSYSDAKEMFKALQYELQANIGLDEQAFLNEACTPKSLFKILGREDGVRRVLKAVQMGGNVDFNIEPMVSNSEQPLDYEKVHGVFTAMYRRLRTERPISTSVFDTLEKLWFPREVGSLGKVGSPVIGSIK